MSAELIALGLIPVILIQRKEPASTFAWILSLIFLPLLGVFLFLLFGRTRIRDRPPRDEPTDLDQAVPAPNASETAGTRKTHFLEHDCFSVTAALTHMPATSGNAVKVLIDGDQTYQAIGAAMDAAQLHIHAEYYLILDDKVGRRFGERLAAAARRGVTVRLIKDGYGSFLLSRRWVREAVSSGVQVKTFLPMRSIIITPASLRNHRKIVVVDGSVGFTGGINICEHGRDHSGADSWRDVHLQIEGPAVAQLQRVFLADWFFITNERLSLTDLIRPQTSLKTARVAIVPNGPDTHTEAIHRVFFTAIVGATSEILITSPYFGPDDTILVALEVAALRGVEVTLIVPARSNHRVTFHSGRSLYDRLLEAGVHIYEYQPGMIHAKTLLIDRRLALVGSSNMDLRSFRLNFEVHALIEDPEVSARLYESMQQDLANSVPIELAAWRTRGLPARLIEGASRLVSPLL